MLTRLYQDSAYLLYSFYNPQEAYKQKVSDVATSIIISNDFAAGNYDSLPWDNLYYYFDNLDIRSNASDTILSCEKYIELDENSKCKFWRAFGNSQSFPMNNASKMTEDNKVNYVAAFQDFASVKRAEKKIDMESLHRYFENGVRSYQVQVGLCPPEMRTVYPDSTSECAYYWLEVIRSHWDQKVDEAFAIYQRDGRPFPFHPKFISDTLSYALNANNDYAFGMLLKTMLPMLQQIKTQKQRDLVEAEFDVCNFTVGYSLLNKKNLSILDEVMKQYENRISSRLRDTTFIRTMKRILPHTAKEIDARKKEIDDYRLQKVPRLR